MVLAVGGHILGEEAAGHCVRWAGGLAGGVGGSRREICGALSGGVLVVGGICGRDQPEADLQLCRDGAARFRERFLDEFGATQCQALLDQVVHVDGGLGSCSLLTERAAQILMEVLGDPSPQSHQDTKDR